jgi:LmeA-like phospholipid-binding
MTAPYTMPPPMMPPRRRRRTGRRILILGIVLLAILGLLVGLDRAAAAITADRIAAKLHTEGFPVEPTVTVKGFPFLTQLISRHLDAVEVIAPEVPVGPVTASIDVHATDITLDSGYQSGTIAQVNGTGLITFASLAKVPALASVPGLKISEAGPSMVKLSANLAIFAATAIARVTLASPHEIVLRLVSASGVPAALLDPIRHLVVQIPTLPLGLTVQSVTVTPQGVVIGVSGSNVSFGQ